MNKYPKSLENLIECYTKLPSVGRRTAERYALYTLFNMDEVDITDFTNALISLKKDIHICPSCGNITESSLCNICSDSTRNKRQIMVVESIKDLLKLEQVNEYSGIYHVLNGAISFSKGIAIDDLNIDSLLEKAKKGEIDEVILATNATIEGETTARYLKELLASYNIKITRIAHGLPVGGDLSYADEMTVLKALEGRREY
ncbi:MAG: recombination protein RecR [Acholeplasmatales bacterium]|nr:recombination protein RecR [Acholeplasmatales bacterium]